MAPRGSAYHGTSLYVDGVRVPNIYQMGKQVTGSRTQAYLLIIHRAFLSIRFMDTGKTHVQNSHRLRVLPQLNTGPDLCMCFYHDLN